jgi:hypothetical protein
MLKPARDFDLYFSAEMTAAEQRAALRRVQAGTLHRVATGIFSALPEQDWPNQLKRERIRLLSALFPHAVISYRSAFDSVINSDEVFLAYTYSKVVDLPGVRIHLVKAPGPQPGDALMQQAKLYFAGDARMFLDNLTIERSDKKRNASIPALENKLVDMLHIRGEDALHTLRDNAKALAGPMSREREYAHLDKMIGNLLGTRPDHAATSPKAQAVALGIDRDRLALFDELVSSLRRATLPKVSDIAVEEPDCRHFAFLESYFSNFIEGTKFSIEQAMDIALHDRIVTNRPQDSHDIKQVYTLAEHPAWRALTLPHTEAAIDQLRQRHRIMMQMRPEVHPGEFKLEANAAGATRFVEPKLVRGTLIEAVKRLADVPPGLPRALLAMFILTEIHPFDDGNGRLARLMMNAELSHAGESRIIIPTVYREPYLEGLRILSREGNPAPFIESMCAAQSWTAAFSYSDLPDVVDGMKKCDAFDENSRARVLLMPSSGA